MLRIVVEDHFHRPADGTTGGGSSFSSVELCDHLMNILGIAAVYSQRIGWLLDGKCAVPDVETLVVIEEDVENAVIRVPEQGL